MSADSAGLGPIFTPVSKFVDAGGIQTHYLECGDPSAPPLVLLHGGGAGATALGNWSVSIPIFARRYRVLAMEMVGFGQTAKPDPATFEYSQAARTQHLIDFLTAMGLTRTPLVGNSMGGCTALGVAMLRPDLVERLVLMGSAGLNSAITPAMQPIVGYDYTIEGMRRLIDALTGPRFHASDEIVQTRHADSIQPETRKAYGAAMGWIGAQGGLFYPEADIAKVKTETLVVNGKDDIVVPLSCAYKFLELLDNSRGYMIPHTGHWVMLEAPEEFAEVVLAFLAREGGVS